MDISRAFQTSSETILYFFKQSGIGYYIPLYQREYSWDDENIEQLMDDICSGVFDLLSEEDKIHFMGTIIVVKENDASNNIKPQDHRAIPSCINNVIDGQQRISTIALLACCLYQKIYEIKKRLPTNSEIHDLDGLRKTAETYLAKIQELFSFDLMRGKPERKPIIIRGSQDGWTFDGKEAEHYKSDISSYLADFIKAIDESNITFPEARKKNLVYQNIKLIQYWLDKVEKSHQYQEGDYPLAWEIVDRIKQSELWEYERPELCNYVEKCKNIEPNLFDKTQKYICSLVQLFAFSSYLLERCCFTVIKPVSQIRAFDMFQSLNATGTPLTAIETFKPLVVNIADSEKSGFKNSDFENSFKKVEQLMKNLRSASSKNKRTNEYLSLFSLTYEGKSLSKQFSTQRKWLIDKFQKDCCLGDNQEDLIHHKKIFIQRMGDVAEYCQKVIYSSTNIEKNHLPELSHVSESDRKLASFCLLYLKDANHKMAHTILSRFYTLAICPQVTQENQNNEGSYHQEFTAACQAVAAFFTLWRSALPTKGLDNVYKNLLEKNFSWQKGNDLVTTKKLKEHFRMILDKKEIGNKDAWKSKATNYLRYNNVQKVCRFVLFITSQDTILDPNEPGLMKRGRVNSSPSYLEPSQWQNKDLKTIEHIAPQNQDLKPDSTWDKALYENDDYEQIGNLTLLPTEINSSIGNKSWIYKWIYYNHLAETDPEELDSLEQKAKQYDVPLKDSTIKLLKGSSYAHHIQSIIKVGATGIWNKELVEKRTERICDLLWEKMYSWLS